MSLQQVFIDIIKLSLWDCPINNGQTLASLSDEDWKSLFEVAQLQGLAAIFIDGLNKLSPKSPAIRRFLFDFGPITIIESEVRWMSQLRIAKKISDVNKENGINTLLLKGIGLSLCYPNPKLRECNDIDIYLFGKYEEGNRIAEQLLGAKIDKYSKKEDHIFFDNCTIDNHIYILWTDKSVNTELNRYMNDLLQNEKMSELFGTNILLPPFDFCYIFLIAHSYGHFMREGMPLRQMVDIACFLKKHGKDIDWNKINKKLQDFKLKKFSDAVLSFIEHFFGYFYGYYDYVGKSVLEKIYNDIFDNNHIVVDHQSKITEKIYLAKIAWKKRWCYDAFYEGGFKQFVKDWFLRKCSCVKKCCDESNQKGTDTVFD